MNHIAEAGDRPGSLGLKLRGLRQARGLSLNDLAQRTGISASFLSLVENGKNDITIGRLTRLVDFYGISIADLIPAPEPEDPDVVGRDGARRLHSETEGIDVYLLTSNTNRAMMPMLVEIEPGAGLAEYSKHTGEEFVHVVDGRLLLDLQGSSPRALEAGESAYYPGERPHLFRNASEDQPLRLLCVDVPPAL